MRNAWKLFTHDLHKAVSNTVGIILVLGLTLIPALFSWFNVAASWDPFGNAKNITFAVANTDKGYKSDLVPMRINVGSTVESTLRSNQQLDWVFTSKDDAIEGTKSGKYYASVIIPPSFSKDMMTFLSSDTDHAKLTYFTNEKKNALAPKITGQGADEVSVQINKTFTKTITDVALNLVSTLSKELTKPETQALVANLNSRIDGISGQLHTAATSTTAYTTLLDSASSLVTSSTQLVDGSKGSGAQAKKSIDSALGSAKSIQSTLDGAANSLSGAISQSAVSYDAVNTNADKLLDSAGQLSSDSSATLTSLATQVDSQISSYRSLRTRVQNLQNELPSNSPLSLEGLLSALDDAISVQTQVRNALNTAASNITSTASTTAADRQKIKNLANEAKSSISKLKTNYDSGLKPQLAKLSGQIQQTASSAGTVAGDVTSAVNDLSSSAGSVAAKLQGAKGVVTDLSKGLDTAATKLDKLHEGLSKALSSGSVEEIQKVIGSDPDGLAAALVAPVAVKRTAVFPVANFGSSMTPLYAIIALWVGTLLICVSIRTQVSRSTLNQLEGIKPRQIYWGRFGIFAVISLLQSTFECLGLMLFIKVQAVHPFLFLLTGWVSGLVFVFIVYTLVASFGNVGKAIGVLFLVIQVSGAGGAYPLQVLPKFYQDISPFLPATHSINMIRSAIAGIYNNDYWISMGYLLLFLIPTLLLGLVLRKPVISMNRKIEAATERTRLL